MENEIMAPCDGQVTSVVAKGTSAQTGMVLCTIK
jgi:biotin carboxyl carrier protein